MWCSAEALGLLHESRAACSIKTADLLAGGAAANNLSVMRAGLLLDGLTDRLTLAENRALQLFREHR
jgi:hypothetical protein